MKLNKKMKFILCASLISALTIGFMSCKSNDAEEVDSYSDSTVQAPENSSNDAGRTEIKAGKSSTDGDEYDDEYYDDAGSKSSKKSGFWDRFWGKDKYTEYDSCTIFTTTALMSLKNQDGVVAIQNKSHTVGFGSPYLAAYYYVTFDDENRNKFISLVDKYHNDFDEKKLKRDDSKSYKAYGSVKVRLDWGTVKASTGNYATAYANIGYKFKDKKPYMTITIYSTVNQKKVNGDAAAVNESINLTYYMTKAQARDLANKLSDEAVKKVAEENVYVPVESDDY